MTSENTKPFFRKIVLAACGTETCEGALRESIRLAAWSKASLIGVSVVIEGGDGDDLILDGGAASEAKCENVVRMVCDRAAAAGVSCKGVVRHDQDAAAAIADVAEDEKADLVVTGRRDRSVLSRFLFGSVSADLLHREEACVLVVPREARFEGRRVLLATDGEEHSILATVYAHYVAAMAGAALTAVVIGDDEAKALPAWKAEADAIIARIEEWSRREGIDGSGQIRYGRPAPTILEAARAAGADLIVLGSHGRAGLRRVLQGSVSENVVAGAECPVMIVRG